MPEPATAFQILDEQGESRNAFHILDKIAMDAGEPPLTDEQKREAIKRSLLASVRRGYDDDSLSVPGDVAECPVCGEYVSEAEHECPGLPKMVGEWVWAVPATKRKVAFLRRLFADENGREAEHVKSGVGYILLS